MIRIYTPGDSFFFVSSDFKPFGLGTFSSSGEPSSLESPYLPVTSSCDYPAP